MDKLAFAKTARVAHMASILTKVSREALARAAIAKVSGYAMPTGEAGFMPQHTQEQYISPGFMSALGKAGLPPGTGPGKVPKPAAPPPAAAIPAQRPAAPPRQAPAQAGMPQR